MSDANSSGIIFDDEKLNTFFNSMKRADRYKMVMNAYEIATHPLIDESKGALIRSLKRRSKTQNLYNSLGLVKGKKTAIQILLRQRSVRENFHPTKAFTAIWLIPVPVRAKQKKDTTVAECPPLTFSPIQ